MVGRKVRIERVPFHEYPAALQQCFPLRFETAAERRRDDSAYLWVHLGERSNHVVLREMGPQLSFLRPYGRLAHCCYSLPIGSGPTALRRRSNYCTALRTVFQLVVQKISWYSGAEVVWQRYSSGLRTFERRTLADQTRVHGVATLLLVGNTRGRRAEPVASLRAGRGNLSHIFTLRWNASSRRRARLQQDPESYRV